MSGGYIHCGSFLGSDKSGSAISGVLDALPDHVPPNDRPRFLQSVVVPMREALSEREEYILIGRGMVERLLPAIETFCTRVGQELGFPDPWDAPGMDEKAGLNPGEAKWGKGKGWQYYCANDLLQACRASLECGEPICISFD